MSPACLFLGFKPFSLFFILDTCPQNQQRDQPFPRGFIHARAWQHSSSRPAALLHEVMRNSCCFTGQLMSWPFPYTFVLFAKNTTLPFNSRALPKREAPCTSLHAGAEGTGWAKSTAQCMFWQPTAQGWMKEKGSSLHWFFFSHSFLLLCCFNSLLLALSVRLMPVLGFFPVFQRTWLDPLFEEHHEDMRWQPQLLQWGQLCNFLILFLIM